MKKMQNVNIFLIALFTISLFPWEIRPEKILVVSMMNSKSVKNFYNPLYIELANRGHELTIISPFKTSDHPRIRDIIGHDILSLNGSHGNILQNVFEERKKGKHILPLSMTTALVGLCKSYYSKPEIQELMKTPNQFDLIIAFYTFNECGFGLVHHFQKPFILLHANVILPWNNPTGLPIPPSHVPLPFFQTMDQMDFFERLRNTVVGLAYGWIDGYYRIPKMEEVYREFVPGAPSAEDIARNVSLVLTNSHFSLNFPRPLMPDVIEVGGMHCRPGKVLPKEIQDFIDSSAPDGFIFFSLGSIVQAHTMPEDIRQSILKSFSKLKQKVLWKWETETMEDLPPNVKLSKWLPQQDILASDKIRLFITHGGLHSIEEAIYHAVPLVGIPLYGDQDANLKIAEKFGFTLMLDLNNLTETSLSWAINKVLGDKTYDTSVKKMSVIFRDRLDEPLSRAAFWTEYVIRNEGAHHLKSPAREFTVFTYYSLDVLLTFIIFVLILIFITIKILVFIFKAVWKVVILGLRFIIFVNLRN